jgi:lysophospholipase L1-like esterase
MGIIKKIASEEYVVNAIDKALNGDAPEIIITENASGYWWNNNGVPEFYVPTDGSETCSKETNYITATKGDVFRVTIRTSDGHPANGAWYDANKNVISVIIVDGDQGHAKTVELTAPTGTAYVRFFSHAWQYNLSDVPMEVIWIGQDDTPTSTSPLNGKKIVYDGDSVCASWGISTNGGSYPQIIADIVGGTFDNQGVGGGRIVTQEGSSDTFHSVVDNLVNLPTDGDLYCFEGGINDHWNDVPLGAYSKSDYTGVLDKTTYCGALETIFRYATTKLVGKPICYIITHKCPHSAFSTHGTEHTFADFREAALGICEKYSIPVYDAWKDSGINSWNEYQLASFFIDSNDSGTGDGTHPNEAGYRRYYVPQLIELFERIMPIGVTDVETLTEPEAPSFIVQQTNT